MKPALCRALFVCREHTARSTLWLQLACLPSSDEVSPSIDYENDRNVWMCVSGDLVYIHIVHKPSADILLRGRQWILEQRSTDSNFVPTVRYEAVPSDCEPAAGMSSLEEFHRQRSGLAVLNDDGSVKGEDTIRSEAGS